jgi:hypothetical protein
MHSYKAEGAGLKSLSLLLGKGEFIACMIAIKGVFT